MNWYAYSLIALVLMGSQRFLYKVSAETGCNTAWTTFSFMGVVTVISAALFFLSGEPVPSTAFLVLTAGINSISFVVATISHMEALKRLPAGLVYPLIRLNAVLVVIFSVIFFRDPLSGLQAAGIASAMAAVFFLTRGGSRPAAPARRTDRQGPVFVLVSVLGGAVAAVSSKFAALYTSKLGFMTLAYLLGTLFSLAFRNRLAAPGRGRDQRRALLIGWVMGLFNFFGFYAFLKALSLGPLSLVVSVTALHFVIAVVLSSLIYGERLTRSRAAGIVLTIVSMLLLRM